MTRWKNLQITDIFIILNKQRQFTLNWAVYQARPHNDLQLYFQSIDGSLQYDTQLTCTSIQCGFLCCIMPSERYTFFPRRENQLILRYGRVLSI